MVLSASRASQAAVKQVASLPFAQRIRHPVYRAWLRFAVFGRGVPAMLFGLVGWIQFAHLQTAISAAQLNPTPRTLSLLVSRGLYLLFCSIPVGLYLTRPMPGARDGRLVARSAAFTGTLMQVVIGAFLPVGPMLVQLPGAIVEISAPLSVVAFGFAVYALTYLRRNLSIIPEARRLTTGGPYRLVRHPLYFAEILAAVSLVLSGPHLTPVIAVCVFAVMQSLRAGFEERLLSATFPDYAAYARRTRRIIPLVW
jgi:protein-S-isoprenylcysteine O-methyltransferase Ste14